MHNLLERLEWEKFPDDKWRRNLRGKCARAESREKLFLALTVALLAVPVFIHDPSHVLV